MLSLKRVFFAVVAAAATLSSLSPTAAVAHPEDDGLEVYLYTYYSDPEMTTVVDTVAAQCHNTRTGEPYTTIPAYQQTPYYTQEFLYLCTNRGPYDPG